MEFNEEEALRKAARAGLQLLEINQALTNEVNALHEHVAVLESERHKLRTQLRAREEDVASVTEDRKALLLEINILHNELTAKSGLVTNLLEREDFLQQQVQEAEAAKRLAENHISVLRTEVKPATVEARKTQHKKHEFAVVNPAATYDSSQASVFTIIEYEELQNRLLLTSKENEAHLLELKSLRKEVETLRRKAAQLPEYMARIQRLEKRNEKLQVVNESLCEERMEEQAVLDSLRSANLMYKTMVESRPFAVECSCSTQKEEPDTQASDVTVRDLLIETNMKLETELRELRAKVHLPHEEVLDQTLKRMGSNGSMAPSVNSSIDSVETANERLSHKLHMMTEKYNLLKDMLHHTKVQWCAAVASQKALEECYESSQEKISQLTQQLDDYLADANADDKERQIRALVDGDESGKWTEMMGSFPAPPGDLNSPLIRCLLNHWTTDKSKGMVLTDWLHNSIRGTGRATPLRLMNLTSEVAAGFTQLLVPIMRERYGVSVSIYRRDNLHVLSDLMLQTNHPSATMPSSPTAAPKVANATMSVHLMSTNEPELDPALYSTRETCSSDDNSMLKDETSMSVGARTTDSGPVLLS